jgi:hypothetical protein
MATEHYTSPLEQSLRDAEHVIGHMVTQPGAEWDVASHGWVVGGNVAELPAGANGADKVFVTQALGPNAAEKDHVYYTAKTPYGNLSWRAGATALHGVLRDPKDGTSAWTSVDMVQRGLDAVKAAKPQTPPES